MDAMSAPSQDWTKFLPQFDTLQAPHVSATQIQENKQTCRNGSSQPGRKLQVIPQATSVSSLPTNPVPSQSSRTMQVKAVSRWRRLKKILGRKS